jgi:D-alanyl-D-alanine carboxypeptidase/D-alanyl-D-alanine-endopeptidase (penicillin-binding protein 4)
MSSRTVLALAVATSACAGEPPSTTLAEATAAARGATVVERFVAATGFFLGTEYVNGPLGEGDAGGPDPDPRVDFARADCVTYLEQSLAVALAGAAGDEKFLRALDAVRYRDGHVSFADRNHYMATDWIPANAWLVEEVTAEVAPGLTQTVERTIDRAAFLRDAGAEPRPGVDDARTHKVEIVPRERLADVADRIRSGDLVFWVGKRDGIFVVHTGLAVRDEDGALLFRHGSSKAGRTLDESFADYNGRATFALGFLVLRLREDVSLPAAGIRE